MNSDTFRFPLGRFSCTAIQDNAARYPIAMFLTNLPRERYEPELLRQGNDPQQIELPYTCLFIDTGRERVLVDTGIGADYPGSSGGKLASLIRREGIEPAEVNTVILSHAHPDHIGGCLNEAGKPAFANARYVLFRQEWDYWRSSPSLAELPVDDSIKKAMRASADKNLSGIQEHVDLLEPDTEIMPGIRAIAAFGHSPGQMGLEISSAGQRLLFVADAIIVPLHLDYPESLSATDHRPSEVAATRIKLLEQAAGDKSLVSASHFAFPGLGYVVAKGNRWEWKSVAARPEGVATVKSQAR